MKTNILKKAIYGFAIMLMMISCKEKESDNDYLLSRTFHPHDFTFDRTALGQDSIVFLWNKVHTSTYVLELYRDSMDYVNGMTRYELPEDAVGCTITGLWCGTRYSARIKAIHNNPNIPESTWKTPSIANPTFVTPTAGIFIGSLGQEIVDNLVVGITVNWNPRRPADRISISTADGESASFPLTAEEMEAGQKTIDTDLIFASGVLHYIRIHRGEAPMGQFSATPPAMGIFNPVLPEDIGLNHITATWNPVRPVDRISIMLEGVEVTSVPLTAGDVSTTFTDLMPGTNYTMRIFEGELCRGVMTVGTFDNVTGVEKLNDMYVKIGETKTLKAYVLPVTAGNKNVTWSSDNDAVATIDGLTGELTGHAVGVAVITATSVEGGFTASCNVNVFDPEDLSLGENLLLNPGFEEPIQTEAPFTFLPIQDWQQITIDWVRAYYALNEEKSGPKGLGPGFSTNVANSQRDIDLNPSSGLLGNGNAGYFKALGGLGGNSAVKIANAGGALTGGIYQIVTVEPGKTYYFGATIGMRPNGDVQTLKNYETLKLLSPDGMELYYETVVDPTNPQEGDVYEDFPNPTLRMAGIRHINDVYTVPDDGSITEIRFQFDARAPVGGSTVGQLPVTMVDDCFFIPIE